MKRIVGVEGKIDFIVDRIGGNIYLFDTVYDIKRML